MTICSPFIPKYLSSPRSVCVDGTIYLLADNTKKVYSYDPEQNMWQKVRIQHQFWLPLDILDISVDKAEYSFVCLFDFSSGAAATYAAWEWWPGDTRWQALCHRRPLEGHGGWLRSGGGGLQPSVQHLGGGVLPAKTMVLQWCVHHLPRPVTMAWALSHWCRVAASDSPFLWQAARRAC